MPSICMFYVWVFSKAFQIFEFIWNSYSLFGKYNKGCEHNFQAAETEKEDNKNSIQRKETKNNTLNDAAE